MSHAQPYVSGKRLILANNMRRPQVLGIFSCHWAAVAAMVRLHQPAFASLGGDKQADLLVEVDVRAALRAANWKAPS